MSLSCGGRGPCCHVGYAHRHCEHCDVVIATNVQPHVHTYYGTYGLPWYGYQTGLSSLGGTLSSWGFNQFQQLANQQALQSAVTEVPIDAGQQSSST